MNKKGTTFSIIILVILTLFGIQYKIKAQTKLDCDSLLLKIKEIAVRHVNNNENMKTEMVITIFGRNDSCYSSSQIAEIYEKEFALLKKRKSNFWKSLIPNAGWISAVILFILLLIKDSVKKIVNSIIKLVGNWFYNKFSGSKLLRRTAIRKYRKALIKKYEKIKIVFRPNRPLKMAEVFVPIKVLDSSDKRQMDVLDAISSYNKIVVLGDPGSGKSMLCKNILFNFGNYKLSLSTIPILLELHRLTDANVRIESLLEDELTRNDFPNSKGFLEYNLKQGKLLILFDGYDEINTSNRIQVTKKINDFIDLYKKCHFVITSRIAVYKDEFSESTEKTLKMVEFDHHQIRLFLKSWGTDMPTGKSIDQLLLTLLERPKIMAMAANPLMLTIIAYLYTDTPHIFPHSRGEFYEISTDILLKQWHVEHNLFDSRDKALILQHLALENQDETANKGDNRKFIHYTKAKKEIELILPKLNLDIENVQPIINEIVERSGLLISVDGGEYYQFAHLTTQEYFAAKQLIDNPVGILERFKLDHDIWRETLKLWCGLVNDATKMIADVFSIDPILAFECLADARRIEPEITTKILNHFKVLLVGSSERNIEIEKAFGIIASDGRPRGKEIFSYLINRFNKSTNKKELAVVANALSYTFLNEAAEVIAGKYHNCLQLHDSLLQMGDIAVSAFVKIGKGDFRALYGLKQIATPNAAKALADLIWEDNSNAIIAAWLLADLIRFPNIENSLRQYLVSSKKRELPIIDWAWQPFNEPINSSLPTIIGRMVNLIHQGNGMHIEFELELDKRISIPLSILHSTHGKIKAIEVVEKYVRIENSFSNKEKQDILEWYNGETRIIKLCSIVEKKESIKNKTPFILKLTKIDTLFGEVLNKLPDSFAFNLLKCHIKGRQVTKEDWINIFNRSNYNFHSGWHYKAIFTVFIIFNLSSLGYCGYLVWNAGSFLNIWIIFQFICILAVIYNLYFMFYFRFKTEWRYREAPEINFLLGVWGFLIMPVGLIIEISEFDWDSFKKRIIPIIPTVLWFPFICYYNYLLLRLYLDIYLVIGLSIGIIVSCALLTIRGRYVERKSKSSFKGLLENQFDQQEKRYFKKLLGLYQA